MSEPTPILTVDHYAQSRRWTRYYADGVRATNWPVKVESLGFLLCDSATGKAVGRFDGSMGRAA